MKAPVGSAEALEVVHDLAVISRDLDRQRCGLTVEPMVEPCVWRGTKEWL